MKVGDIVQVVGSHAQITGTIVSTWKVEGWWEVLVGNRIIHWPESQMLQVEL